MLLIPDICSHHLFVEPYRGYKVASGPEHLAGEVPLPAPELPRDRDRALALHVSHHVGHRVLGRNAQAHVHMIGHQMSLYHLRFLMLRQFLKNLPEVSTQNSEHLLLAPLRNENNVVLTIPSGMAKTLILFHRCSPTSFGEDSENHRDRRIGQTLVSPPA